MKRIVLMSLLLSAAAPAMLPAQGRQPGTGVMQREHGALDALLKHRAELRLTDDQVARLTALDQRLDEQNRALREQFEAAGLGEMRERGHRRRDLSPAEREQLRARMQAARPLLEQLRENNRAAREQVRQILTAEQQNRLRELRSERREQMRDNRGKRGDQRRPRRDGARRQGRNP